MVTVEVTIDDVCFDDDSDGPSGVDSYEVEDAK